jgi:hypothetical protein
MATSKEEASYQEGRTSDHESDIGSGDKIITPRERILFAMSMIRTLCGLITGLAGIITLWKVYHLGGH